MMSAAERLAKAFHEAYDSRALAVLEDPYRRMTWGDAPEDYRALMISAAQSLVDVGVVVPTDL